MPSSLSKDATRSTAPQQAVQINSFEAALAKKGIVIKAAPDKSPRKEQYFADLNGHTVTRVAFFFWFHPRYLIQHFISSLPVTCEVNSPEIHDVLLEEDYAALPNLTWVLVVGSMFLC
jgi:hypothetical protein